MPKTFNARVRNGRIEPSEPLELPEGSDLVVTVTRTEAVGDADPTAATAGAWDEIVDCEALEKDLYETRLLNPRPAVNL